MIIETKLLVPVTKGVLISRRHLRRKLDKGLSCRLTVLEAATGNGKSTLLSEWSASISYPVAWVSLDEYDNHNQGFWLHVIASLQTVLPDMDCQFARRYLEEDLSGATLIANLLNFLNQWGDEIILVWDDFHVLRQQVLLDGIDYFLRRLSPNVHVYIAGRTQSPLMLSKLRVKGQLNELTASEFTLSSEEMKCFLGRKNGLELDEESVRLIEARTEGWIAGLSMVSLLLQQYKDEEIAINHHLVETVTSTHQQIADYFLDEVLSKQSKTMQKVLLQTAILERMNAPLLETVTETTNGLAILQHLEQENLFLVSLDYEQQWYRYHHLFRQFLQMELNIHQPEWERQLRHRAATWLEAQGYVEEALEHYFVVKEYEVAISLLERVFPRMLSYERASLFKWLNQLPDELLLQYPDMYLQNAASLFLSGFINEATEKYWRAVEQLENGSLTLSQENKKAFETGLDLLVAFRCFLERDFTSFQIYSEKYIGNDPEGSMFVNFGMDQHGYHQAWDVFISDGSSNQAMDLLPPLLRLWSKTENRPFYAHLCMDYAALLYERNDVLKAKEQIEKALRIASSYEIKGLMVNGVGLRAKIMMATNQEERALAELEGVVGVIQEEHSLVLLKRADLSLRELQLKQGKISLLSEWSKGEKFRVDDEISPPMFATYFVFARILTLQGDRVQVKNLMNRLIVLAKRAGIKKDVCRFLVYKSSLLLHQHKQSVCFVVLEEALEIAEREGFVRTILDLGVEDLLHAYITAAKSKVYPYACQAYFTYAKHLHTLALQDRRNRQETNERASGKTIALTKKEGMVLAYIDEGLSNKDIAATMEVSLSTVKTHINHMYRKLNVSNRVLAIRRARKLGLLN